VIPRGVSSGQATVIVQPPEGPSVSQKVNIRRNTPGLYSGTGTGESSGFAFDNKGNIFPLLICSTKPACTIAQLPLSSTPGGLDFVLYGTGFRSGAARLRIGTHRVFSRISQHAGSAGVAELNFHLPQDFPLRLYQSVLAETVNGDSNVLWIYLE
jgi:uncharacterized protein (TIGR03437 family)